MYDNDHERFLYSVRVYVQANPEVAGRISDYVTAGLTAALRKTQERAADMEACVAVLASARYSKKNRDKLLAAKLRQWSGQSSMRWDSLIEELEGISPHTSPVEAGNTGGAINTGNAEAGER